MLQSDELHVSSSRLDVERSKRLATMLRSATESTEKLYGSDVMTAYQLMSSILQRESLQQGFELSATHHSTFNEVQHRISAKKKFIKLNKAAQYL